MTRHRGRKFMLSPPDFALARRWYETKLPLAAVLSGIDLAISRGDDVTTLRTADGMWRRSRGGERENPSVILSDRSSPLGAKDLNGD